MKIQNKVVIFFKLLPFANLVIENLSSRYLENIVARSFKHGQLVEDDE